VENIRHSVVVRIKAQDERIDEIEDDEVLKQLPKYYFDSDPNFDIRYHLLKVSKYALDLPYVTY